MVLKTSAILPVLVLGLGNILHLVGLNTAHWTVAYDPNFGYGNSGLWEFCVNGKCTRYPEWYTYRFQVDFCQSTAVLGMVCGVLALLFTTVANLTDVVEKDASRVLGRCGLGSSAISCIMISSSVVVWTTFYQNTLDYSFYCSTAGAVLIPMGGIIKRSANRQTCLEV